MTTQYDLFAIGECVIDLISSEITDDIGKRNNYRLFPGGQVSNLAANVARLGRKVSLATCWGDDGFGRLLEHNLINSGVSLDHAQTTNQAATTLSVIARNLESPDFIIHRGADCLLKRTDEMVDTATASAVIHTSAFALSREPARSTILETLQAGQASGKTITIDPNYHPGVWPDSPDFLEILKASFQYATITKPSLVDCQRLFGEGKTPQEYAAIFKDWGAKNVIITMGDQGVYVAAEEVCSVIRTSTIEIADVTGAGDAFWSGLISGIIEGKGVVKAALCGQAVAEIKLQTLGPIKQMPTWEEILDKSKTIKYEKC